MNPRFIAGSSSSLMVAQVAIPNVPCEPWTRQRPHDDFEPEDMPKPHAPTTFCEEYDVNRANKFWPQPPEPYKTFEGSKKVCMVKPTAEDRIEYDRSYNDFTFEEYMEALEKRDPWKE